METDKPTFVHSVEAEFASILNYYGVEWEYEPKTFALEWDEAGKVTKAFSPDFYLPNEDLYVELTTMRPALVTRKNKKLRQMKELYPEVKVKLLKRSDLRQLMIKFGRDHEAVHIVGTAAQKRSERNGAKKDD